MEFIATYFNDPIQSGLVRIGVDTPLKTTILFTGVTAAAQWAIRPSLTFDSQGRPKQWNLIPTSAADASIEKTPLPWYLVSLTVGYLAGLVI